MKNIIYRNHATTTFAAAFMNEAMAYSTKLEFNTREEYLAWVKNWKEEYKIVELYHKSCKLSTALDRCQLQSKKDAYQKRLDKLPNMTEEQMAKYKEISGKIASKFGLNQWIASYPYWILIGMLIERKAGKIKARAQRNARLVEEKK